MTTYWSTVCRTGDSQSTITDVFVRWESWSLPFYLPLFWQPDTSSRCGQCTLNDGLKRFACPQFCGFSVRLHWYWHVYQLRVIHMSSLIRVERLRSLVQAQTLVNSDATNIWWQLWNTLNFLHRCRQSGYACISSPIISWNCALVLGA